MPVAKEKLSEPGNIADVEVARPRSVRDRASWRSDPLLAILHQRGRLLGSLVLGAVILGVAVLLPAEFPSHVPAHSIGELP